jgi:hypothetical protein
MDSHRIGVQNLSWSNLQSGPDPASKNYDYFRGKLARSEWQHVFSEEVNNELYLQLCEFLMSLQGERKLPEFTEDLFKVRYQSEYNDLFKKGPAPALTKTFEHILDLAQPKSGPVLVRPEALSVTLEYERCYDSPTSKILVACLQFVARFPLRLESANGIIRMVAGIYVWKDKPRGRPIAPGTVFSGNDAVSFLSTAATEDDDSRPPSYFSRPGSVGSTASRTMHGLGEGKVYTPEASEAGSVRSGLKGLFRGQ